MEDGGKPEAGEGWIKTALTAEKFRSYHTYRGIRGYAHTDCQYRKRIP